MHHKVKERGIIENGIGGEMLISRDCKGHKDCQKDKDNRGYRYPAIARRS